MPQSDLVRILLTKCAKLPEVDSVLLGAIIETESSWRPNLIRFEPNFTYFAKPEQFALKNGITSKTELMLQRCSFGLGQLMGATSRGLGFDGMLTDLLQPDLNIDYMLLYYQKICGQYVYTEDKIAAYNAGTVRKLASGRYFNQDYVDKVLGILEKNPIWQVAKDVLPVKEQLV